MKCISISVLVCMLIVASGIQALAEEWTSEQKEVWEMIEEMFENFKAGDLESVLAVRHDKMLGLGDDKTIPTSKDDTRASYKSWFAGVYKPTSYMLKPIAINIIDNIAFVFYFYQWEAESVSFSSRGRSMATYVKKNNKWIYVGYLDDSCDKLPPCPNSW